MHGAVAESHVAATWVARAEREFEFAGRVFAVGRIVAASQTLGKVAATSRIEGGMIERESVTEITALPVGRRVYRLADKERV